MPYAEAIAKVAGEIDRIQKAHGNDAFGVLSGASLTTEKAYLMGKFARVCLKTRYIDYNGRLCMVSAGAGNKKAFGIDRTTSPWSDMVGTEVIWVAGSNVAECSPITTDYLWQAREMGAKIIVQDPRITPIARTCDLFLPVKPGRDAALFAGVLNLMIEKDWVDREFIEAHTVGFEQVAAYCREWPAAKTAEVTGVPERSIRQAAEWWGRAKTSFLFHARGIEHHSNGVHNVLGSINLVLASGRIGKPKSGYGTIVGQANGQGGREHGQKCDQLPGLRDISNPEHRKYIAGVWGVDETTIPGPGVDAYEMFRKIDAGEIKGLMSLCFNPKISLPDNNFVARCLDKLEFYVVIDFFLNDSAHHADIVLPGSLQEEDEGTVTQVEGRVIKINQAVECPGEARQDWRIIQDLAAALGRPHGFTFDSPGAIFQELRRASKGGVSDYSGITYEKIEQNYGVFWPCYSTDPQTGRPTADHPGTPRLFERGSYNPVAKGAGPFYFPDGKARFNVADYQPPVDDASPSTPTTTPPAASSASSSPARRRAASARWWTSTPSRASRCTRGSPRSSTSRTATGRRPRPAAARSRSRRRSSRRSAPTRSSSPTTGPARRARTNSRSQPRTRSARSPSTKSAAAASARPTDRRTTRSTASRSTRAEREAPVTGATARVTAQRMVPRLVPRHGPWRGVETGPATPFPGPLQRRPSSACPPHRPKRSALSARPAPTAPMSVSSPSAGSPASISGLPSAGV